MECDPPPLSPEEEEDASEEDLQELPPFSLDHPFWRAFMRKCHRPGADPEELTSPAECLHWLGPMKHTPATRTARAIDGGSASMIRGSTPVFNYNYQQYTARNILFASVRERVTGETVEALLGRTETAIEKEEGGARRKKYFLEPQPESDGGGGGMRFLLDRPDSGLRRPMFFHKAPLPLGVEIDDDATLGPTPIESLVARALPDGMTLDTFDTRDPIQMHSVMQKMQEQLLKIRAVKTKERRLNYLRLSSKCHTANCVNPWHHERADGRGAAPEKTGVTQPAAVKQHVSRGGVRKAAKKRSAACKPAKR